MNKCLWVAALAGLGGLVYLLAPVLTPFAAGTLVAYLANPLVDSLANRGLKRLPAVVLVFAVISLLVGLVLFWVVPLLAEQVGNFFDDLPAYSRWVQTSAVPWINKHLGLKLRASNLEQLAGTLTAQWQQAGGASAALASLSHSGAVLVSWLLNLALVPVVVFYLLRDWNRILCQVQGLLPLRWAPLAARLSIEIDEVLSAVFRGQLMVMLALATVYSVGLWLVGLRLGLLIGLFAGLASFIPYAGFIVGVLLASIMALAQFGELWPVASVLIVFAAGQMLEGLWLTPWLIGHRIGLHPVAAIFAALAGGRLFGFLGVLLALPMAAVVMVLLRHIHEVYKDSDWYGDSAAELSSQAAPGAPSTPRPGTRTDSASPPDR